MSLRDTPTVRLTAFLLLFATVASAQALPQANRDQPKRIRVPGGMERRLIHRVDPVYPPAAKQARIQGIVRFEILIDTDGSVRDLRVVSGHPMLIQAATDAVRQWRYTPVRWNGELLEVLTTAEVRFVLAQAGEPQMRPVRLSLVWTFGLLVDAAKKWDGSR